MEILDLVNILIGAIPDNTKLDKAIVAGIYYIANAIVQAEAVGVDADYLQKSVIQDLTDAVVELREYRNIKQQTE